MSKGVGGQREWYLRCGMTYTICTNTLPLSTPILGDPRRDGPLSTPNLGNPRRDEPLRPPNLGKEEPSSTPILGAPRRVEPYSGDSTPSPSSRNLLCWVPGTMNSLSAL